MLKVIDRRSSVFNDIVIVDSTNSNVVAEWEHIDDKSSDAFIDAVNNVLKVSENEVYKGALEEVFHVVQGVL